MPQYPEIDIKTLTIYPFRQPRQPVQERVYTPPNTQPSGDGWNFVRERINAWNEVDWEWARKVQKHHD